MSGFACVEVARFVDAYLDGEFAAEDAGALEQHLAACPGCAERVRFQAGFRKAMRQALAPAASPSGLRERMQSALAHAPGPSPIRRHAIRVAPIAAAAAAAAALLVLVPRAANRPPPIVVEDAIARHRRNLPLEVTGPDDRVRAWFADKVDFAVRPPRMPAGYHLVGGRLANVGDRQAAYFVYNGSGDKVTVLVFDASGEALRARERRQIGNREVYLDGERGYNVAVYRDRDIGYAITSDLDEDQMIQLVSTAVQR